MTRSPESPAGWTRSVIGSTISAPAMSSWANAFFAASATSGSTFLATRTHREVGSESTSACVTPAGSTPSRPARRVPYSRRVGSSSTPSRVSSTRLTATDERGTEMASSTPVRSRMAPRGAAICSVVRRWLRPLAASADASVNCTPKSFTSGRRAMTPRTAPTT